MHQQHWLTGLGLSSGTSIVTSISRYQLRIAAASRSHFELVTATTELALGWWWSGQGRYTGAQELGRWRSGHQIQTRDTEAALASIAAGPAAWEETPPPQVPGLGAGAAIYTHHKAKAQAAKATISLQSSSSISTSTAVIPPGWRNIGSFIFYSSLVYNNTRAR